METIIPTDSVRNEEPFKRVKKERNILRKIKRREANGIGHILCRNCLLKRVIEGKRQESIEVTGRRGRIRKQLLEDFKDETGYWN
jgi:hypothetical protein